MSADELREPDAHLVRRMRQIMSFRRLTTVRPDDPVEPRLAVDGPVGADDGPGRGDLTPRQQTRLERLREAWKHGYLKS